MWLPFCEQTSHDTSPQCYGVISRLRFGGTIEDVQRVIGSLSLSPTLIIKRTHLTPIVIIGLVDVTKGLSVCVYAGISYGSDQRQVKCIPNEFTASDSIGTFLRRRADCDIGRLLSNTRQTGRLRIENLVSFAETLETMALSPLLLDLDPLRKPLRINFEHSLDEQDSFVDTDCSRSARLLL